MSSISTGLNVRMFLAEGNSSCWYAGRISVLRQLDQTFAVKNQGQGRGMEREEFHSVVSVKQRRQSELRGNAKDILTS